jgi:hypothetical protein
MSIFLSLALVQRHAEPHSMKGRGLVKPRRRGYVASELPLSSLLGTSSGYLAALVLALYIPETKTTCMYRLSCAGANRPLLPGH